MVVEIERRERRGGKEERGKNGGKKERKLKIDSRTRGERETDSTCKLRIGALGLE